MNIKKLREMIGCDFQIRPAVVHIFQSVRGIPADDLWRLEAFDEKSSTLKVWNVRTDHHLEIGFDNVQEYRSPIYLLLRTQITIKDNRPSFEPIQRTGQTLQGVGNPNGVYVGKIGDEYLDTEGEIFYKNRTGKIDGWVVI